MDSNNNNYEVFRDCLSAIIVEKSNERPRPPSKRKSYKTRRNHTTNDVKDVRRVEAQAPSSLPPARANPEDLAEFVDVLAFTPSLLE